MRNLIPALLLVVVLALAFAPLAFAMSGDPVGTCPTGFELHMAMEHDQMYHSDHMHVGIAADLNGDGWICVKFVTPDSTIHVHTDNYLP